MIVLLAGCDIKTSSQYETESSSQETKTTSELSSEANTSNTLNLNYAKANITKKNSGCSGNECTRVNVEYPKFESEVKLDKALQSKISEYLAEFVMGAKATDNPESIASLFVDSYNDFKKEFPEVQAPWYIEMDVTPTYQSKDFLSFKFETESYGGGAHANRKCIS